MQERKSRRWQFKTLIKGVNKIKGCNLNHQMTESYCDEAVQPLKVDTPCKDHTCTCTIALDEDGIMHLSDIRLCGLSLLAIIGIGFLLIVVILSNMKCLLVLTCWQYFNAPYRKANNNINQQLIKIKLKTMPAEC